MVLASAISVCPFKLCPLRKLAIGAKLMHWRLIIRAVAAAWMDRCELHLLSSGCWVAEAWSMPNPRSVYRDHHLAPAATQAGIGRLVLAQDRSRALI
jgi:hypothetical protein